MFVQLAAVFARNEPSVLDRSEMLASMDAT